MSVSFTVHAAHQNQTVVVTTTDELDAALTQLNAGGGGTILLDGSAGPFQLIANGLDDDAPILIRALDPDVTPLIEKIEVQDSSYLTITETVIDRTAIMQTEAESARDITISGSDHIEIVGNQMFGMADGYLSDADDTAGSLALVRNSSDILFSGNEISGYNHGVTFREVSDSTFSFNELSELQGDGFRGVGLQNIEVTDNYMHDFYGSIQDLNHSDMIQIWTTGAESVTDGITISNNVLDAGSGAGTQSILIGNTASGNTGAANDYPQNITITNNVIHNGAANGIRASYVDGLEISNNTLLWNAAVGTQQSVGDDVISREPGITVVGTLDTVITNNVTSRITVDGTRQEDDNFILDYTDQSDPNYVHDHIVNLSGMGDLDLRDLGILASSAANGVQGAALSWRSDDGAAEAVITTDESFANRQALVLSAAESLVEGDPDQAEYLWTFDDDTQLSGKNVVAVFAADGSYDVTLQVISENGATDSIARTVTVRSNDIIALDFNDGVTDVSEANAVFSYHGWDKSVLVDGAEGQGFRLTGSTLIQIDRENDQLFDLSSFSFEVDYKAQSTSEYGTLMRLPGTMELFITATGALRFRLTTDEGDFEVLTADGVMQTTDWQSIAVSYDGAAGALELYVEDQLAGATQASGTTASAGHYHMYIGNPWSDSVRGVIDNLEMSTEPLAGWSDGLIEGAINGSIITKVFDAAGDSDSSDGLAEDDTQADALISTGPGVVISMQTDDYVIPREASFLHNRSDFRIELQLETNDAGQEGAFLHLHKSLLAQVDANGHVLFTLTTSDGVFDLRSSVPLYDQAAVHDLAFSYDAESGLVQIESDGTVVAQTTASGMTADAAHWGLVLGHAWQEPLDGSIQNFSFMNGVTLQPVDTVLDTTASLGWQAETLMTFEGVIHDSMDASTVFDTLPSSPEYVTSPTGDALHLSTGNHVTFERGAVDLNDVDSFVINFDFQRSSSDYSGRVMHLHEVMEAEIDADGAVHFTLQTDDGTFELVSDTVVFNDTDWHNVQIAYDGSAQFLSLEVDDTVVAVTQASGTTVDASYWGVTIGSAWGESITGNIDNLAFGGEVTEEITADALLY